MLMQVPRCAHVHDLLQLELFDIIYSKLHPAQPFSLAQLIALLQQVKFHCEWIGCLFI